MIPRPEPLPETYTCNAGDKCLTGQPEQPIAAFLNDYFKNSLCETCETCRTDAYHRKSGHHGWRGRPKAKRARIGDYELPEFGSEVEKQMYLGWFLGLPTVGGERIYE